MTSRYTEERGTLTVTTLVTGTWRENCYVVSENSTRAAFVFDPGDDVAEIIAVIEELQLRVDRILLTHAHFDHMGAAAALMARFGAPCSVHEADQTLLRRAPLYAMSFEKRHIDMPKGAETFAAGATFVLGETTFTAMSTPGHTPGSVCFATEDRDLAISGDTLLRHAVGRTDLPGGNRDALVASIGALLEQLPDATLLFAGHGKPWVVGEARAWWAEESARTEIATGPDCGESK